MFCRCEFHLASASPGVRLDLWDITGPPPNIGDHVMLKGRRYLVSHRLWVDKDLDEVLPLSLKKSDPWP